MRPPAPENSARMTGCCARMFLVKVLAASPYRSNMTVLSVRTFRVAVSAALPGEVPTIVFMYGGRSAAPAGVLGPSIEATERRAHTAAANGLVMTPRAKLIGDFPSFPGSPEGRSPDAARIACRSVSYTHLTLPTSDLV